MWLLIVANASIALGSAAAQLSPGLAIRRRLLGRDGHRLGARWDRGPVQFLSSQITHRLALIGLHSGAHRFAYFLAFVEHSERARAAIQEETNHCSSCEPAHTGPLRHLTRVGQATSAAVHAPERLLIGVLPEL